MVILPWLRIKKVKVNGRQTTIQESYPGQFQNYVEPQDACTKMRDHVRFLRMVQDKVNDWKFKKQ